MKQIMTVIFSKLRNSEHFQFHYSALLAIPVAFAIARGLDKLRKVYAALFEHEDEIFKKSTAYEETRDIEELDKRRDVLSTIIFSTVDNNINHQVEARSEAAKKLELLIRPYRGARTLPYAENTSEIRNMTDDLLLPGWTDYLEALNLKPDVELLKQANDDFDQAWQKRSDEKLLRKEAGNMESIRPEVDNAYRELVDILYSSYKYNEHVIQDPDIKAEFEAVIDRLNALSLQVQETVSRRSSASSAVSESSATYATSAAADSSAADVVSAVTGPEEPA